MNTIFRRLLDLLSGNPEAERDRIRMRLIREREQREMLTGQNDMAIFAPILEGNRHLLMDAVKDATDEQLISRLDSNKDITPMDLPGGHVDFFSLQARIEDEVIAAELARRRINVE